MREPAAGPAPEDRRIALTSRTLTAAFALLALVVITGLVVTPDPVDAAVALLLVVVGATAAVHVRALGSREGRRRADAESVARLLRGLARSVSPDAIVGAIAGELAPVADADHVVVIRVRGEPPRLDATLVSTRPGIPSATTQLPMSDLEDPGEAAVAAPRMRPVPVAAEEVATAAHVARRTSRRRGRVDPLAELRAQALLVPPAGAPGGRPAAGLGDHHVPALPRTEDGAARMLGLVDVIEGGRPDTAAESAAWWGRPGGRRSDRERAQRIADRLGERAAEVYGLRTALAAPLVVHGAVSGALVLSRRTDVPWSEASRRQLDEAATEASVALDRASSYKAAETRASTDALTGLPNRRYFDEFCGLLARRRRSGDAIGVLMIDIDRFKLLNDRHGHAVGDEVLRAVGGALISTVRDDDVPARYGGEEFVVLLRNPSGEIAVEIGERVRRAVASLDLRDHGVAGVTVSVGVAVQRTSDQAVADVVEAADQALYRAKRAGRDRVVAA